MCTIVKPALKWPGKCVLRFFFMCNDQTSPAADGLKGMPYGSFVMCV